MKGFEQRSNSVLTYVFKGQLFLHINLDYRFIS